MYVCMYACMYIAVHIMFRQDARDKIDVIHDTVVSA